MAHFTYSNIGVKYERRKYPRASCGQFGLRFDLRFEGESVHSTNMGLAAFVEEAVSFGLT